MNDEEQRPLRLQAFQSGCMATFLLLVNFGIIGVLIHQNVFPEVVLLTFPNILFGIVFIVISIFTGGFINVTIYEHLESFAIVLKEAKSEPQETKEVQR